MKQDIEGDNLFRRFPSRQGQTSTLAPPFPVLVLTRGFSGTNDSRYVLPLSTSQRDLPAQLSTNAKVLGCLLRPENSFEDITKFLASSALDAKVRLRPVHWMVSCRGKGGAVFAILSPFKVQELLSSIRGRKKVTLHVYSPHLIKSARALGDLSELIRSDKSSNGDCQQDK
ncbi:hypothetical protein G7Y89_g14255 [Cudoniella acicularis]|uniref:Uncharacterized protein n=1 Tax=Cudoniella acicularis TaxID=354080 RepID=A0A8H4R4S4_9HELO|nr:hypothetical protein G7Y89_g14255 [Cudoniella acicularis]